MRLIFGVLSLLFVVAVIGFLAKKQITSLSVLPAPAPSTEAATGSSSVPTAPAAPMTPGQQSRQTQEQVRQAVESAMQQPRAMPDDSK